MKFWKSLSLHIEETLPDWRDKFLLYKDLKKQLKLIHPKEEGENQPRKKPRLDRYDGGDGCGCSGREESEVPPKEVTDFITLLEGEIAKFNSFFEDNEEEYVIKWKELQGKVAEAKDSNELIKVGREIVDFHGEMVLLENYSALNYTGLVKIIKKYDKRTGALVRLPFIQRVLQQPFYKTDVLNKLVKECETTLDHLFSMEEPSTSQATQATDDKECDSKAPTTTKDRLLSVPKELADIKTMENMYMKLTVSALRVLKEIRSGSSTVSMFSLPPIQNNSLEDDVKIPVLEQQVAN